ncbi:SIR2 family protein [Paenibacillus elgii]|uniref:SIR2 family protein n=1 Tax=Paenibacillus elgii TaxID=189691 RepID=UPI002D7D3247|nr:SIR2 family protein [Paenibacillus elgii]
MSTVYVFGAGASFPEGAPLISNFIGKSFELLEKDTSKEISDTWKFLRDYFGKDPKNSLEAIESYPTIDEIVTIVDYATSNNISLSSFHTTTKLNQIKKGLVNLISFTIAASIKTNEKHTSFAKELFKKRGSIKIISLNYDTLLDESIKNCYKSFKNNKINYGFNSVLTSDPRFNLLKIHGSLNWSLCPFCQNIQVHDEPIAHFLYSHYVDCENCNNTYSEPVIITPTLLKSYNIQRLNNVWLAASEALSLAIRIVFIGYSLALSDYPIINLIKNAISQKNVLEEVIIVGVSFDKEQLGKRYSKIFNDRIKIAFDDNGFTGQTHWDTPFPKDLLIR